MVRIAHNYNTIDAYISIYEHMFEPLTRVIKKLDLKSVRYINSFSTQELFGLKINVHEMDMCIKFFIEDTSNSDEWLIKVLKYVKNGNSVSLMLFRLVDARPSEKILSFVYSKISDMSEKSRIGVYGEQHICKLVVNSEHCPDWIKAEVFMSEDKN